MIDPSADIHSSSIIVKGATIGPNVRIGPFCFIGADVNINEGSILHSHIVINGHTQIGRYNTIYQFASIGEANQDVKYHGEQTRVEIGDHNTIRESVTIHRGTIQGESVTRIGNHNLFMVNAHVAHDCTIGNQCILANNATLGGHVTVDDYAIIGGMVAVHQWCIIGAHAIIGGCSGVVQDVPPYIVAQGNHATPHGINVVGLKRRGFDEDVIRAIRTAYKLLYRSGKTIAEVNPDIAKLAEQYVEIEPFYQFPERSRRGLIR